jgi:hypothetical protein
MKREERRLRGELFKHIMVPFDIEGVIREDLNIVL